MPPPWVDDPKAPNAFTPAPPPQEEAPDAVNAFTKVQVAQQQNMAYPPQMGQGMPYPMPPQMGQGMPYPMPPQMGQGMPYPMPPQMGQGMPYPMPPQMAMGPRMDQGMPMGMSNAFVTGNTPRPIPANFGPPKEHGNAFVDPNGGTMAASALPPRNPPQGYPPMMAPPPMMQDPTLAQMLTTLRTASYPSHREVAAEQLATFDWRTQPVIVTALMSSAKSDPAATVRAAAVRALVRLKAKTPEVLAALQSLREDKDERVRQETVQGLTSLGVAPVAGDSTVRPASATQIVP